MAFRDQLLRCGACGSDFVYTVKEQRKRAEQGLSTDAPAFCADCRGADVRLAEATGGASSETDTDSGGGHRGNGTTRQSESRRGPAKESRSGGGRKGGRSDRGGGSGGGRSRQQKSRGDQRSRNGKGGGGRKGGRTKREKQTELRVRHVGTVKWFNDAKGYGFIAQEEGGEVFVHLSGVIDDNVKALEIGTPVEFEIEHTPRGPQAVDVIQLA